MTTQANEALARYELERSKAHEPRPHYEETIIDGMLHYRTTPNGDWWPRKHTYDPESMKVILADMERKAKLCDEAITALKTILSTAKKSSFQAVGLCYLQKVAGPVLDAHEGLK